MNLQVQQRLAVMASWHACVEDGCWKCPSRSIAGLLSPSDANILRLLRISLPRGGGLHVDRRGMSGSTRRAAVDIIASPIRCNKEKLTCTVQDWLMIAGRL